MLYCNVIHKTSDKLEPMMFQQEQAHKLGIRTTMLISYDNLFSEEVISYCKEQKATYGDEVGMYILLIGKIFNEKFKTREYMLHLLPMETQKAILTEFFEKFNEVMGYYPKSIGTYYLSSQTLEWIHENYPSVKIAIINCFEEGVHMYHGNVHWWNLFNEGSPWSAFYPSKANSMCPARSLEESVGIIGVPHLNRDMLMAYIGRDDCYSSHSANMQRGKVNVGNKCDYIYDFLDEWIVQGEINDDVYYNTLVSPGWLTEGCNFEETMEDSRDLYVQTLQSYRTKADEGKLTLCTMSEYADIHNAKASNVTKTDANLWHDLLYGTKREIFWYASSEFRAALDINAGGAIVDLRPYAGRLVVNPGKDTDAMWDGSYPFALQYLHRLSLHTCLVGDSELSNAIMSKPGEANLLSARTTAKAKRLDNGDVVLTLEPAEIFSKGAYISVKSEFTFKADGRICMSREIVDCPDGQTYDVCEYFKGTYGTNEYPKDISGTELYLKDGENLLESITEGYLDRKIVSDKATVVGAKVPQLNTVMEFSGEDNPTLEADEGYMFWPYYSMKVIHKNVKKGEVKKTWLQIKEI